MYYQGTTYKIFPVKGATVINVKSGDIYFKRVLLAILRIPVFENIQRLITVKQGVQSIIDSEILTDCTRFHSSISIGASNLDLYCLLSINFFAKDWHKNKKREDGKSQS